MARSFILFYGVRGYWRRERRAGRTSRHAANTPCAARLCLRHTACQARAYMGARLCLQHTARGAAAIAFADRDTPRHSGYCYFVSACRDTCRYRDTCLSSLFTRIRFGHCRIIIIPITFFITIYSWFPVFIISALFFTLFIIIYIRMEPAFIIAI